MVAFVPQAVTRAAAPALQSQGAAPGAAGQQWAQIPVGAAQEEAKLECKLVTAAAAVFVLLAQDTGLALALWDFESQDVRSSHFGRSSVFVECSAELPLCLLLTGEGLSAVLRQLLRGFCLPWLLWVTSIAFLLGWSANRAAAALLTLLRDAAAQEVAALSAILAWLCLSERGLSLVLFGVSQEEFLSRLMMFGSAGVVDSVCHLNGWERCSIPIHALEVSRAASCPAAHKLGLSKYWMQFSSASVGLDTIKSVPQT